MADPAPLAGLLVSDFQVGNLAAVLEREGITPPLRIVPGPFGQVIPTLLDPPGPPSTPEDGETPSTFDFAVVWARPEAVSAHYARAVHHHPVEAEAVEAEIDRFIGAIRRLRTRVPNVLVCTFVGDPSDRGLGILDRASPGGLSRLRAGMNEQLVHGLQDDRGVLVLDAERWIARAGEGAFDPRLWYMAKIPFAPAVFHEAAREIGTAVTALRRGGRKLLLVDLDHTLWGGIVGEVGAEGLRLGGHDPVGEAYVDFQRAVEALTRRGIVLGIVSKNEESVALEAIASHPEMVLRAEHFAGWRINWQDKAANVASLVDELNLGLDAAVFIDDQPAERARVREALPQVLVPEWPDDPLRYREHLRALTCFDVPALSDEDRARADSYAAERRRKEVRASVGSVEEWLRELGVRVRFEPLSETNVARAAQLLNKTNQMNLRTRRISESELWDWVGEGPRATWVCRVSDRFGDAGITGLVSVEADGSFGHIQDFILSCRVFGRRVEDAMTALAVEWARTRGLEALIAAYRPTDRNLPCLRFWDERSGFERMAGAGGDAPGASTPRGSARGTPEPDEEVRFRWEGARVYPWPETVEVEGAG